jgi:FO synthase subunit 1
MYMGLRVITYSRNVFLPITTVCRNRCDYCCFRTPVQEDCILRVQDVTETLVQGARLGCTEALFTFGERPGDVLGFDACLRDLGYTSILRYCHDLCSMSIGIGLLPHTNAGILSYDELEYLRPVNASMGLMLETTAEVPAHRRSPGKDPKLRIEMIENAGKLRIPFTTGLLLGIGERMEDRENSLTVIRDLHRRYGHIQEVIIQNFTPKPGIPMALSLPPDPEEICVVIRMAKEILPDDIAVQVPPNLVNAGDLIRCGVDDLGGVSPVTIDYINPEHPWPGIDSLKAMVGDASLKERLCIYPKYIEKEWYPGALEPLIKRLDQDMRERER